jgi:PAS domain S-box-containing protein
MESTFCKQCTTLGVYRARARTISGLRRCPTSGEDGPAIAGLACNPACNREVVFGYQAQAAKGPSIQYTRLTGRRVAGCVPPHVPIGISGGSTERMPDDLSLRHLAKIVDSSDDAIVSKDLDGTILSWNAAAERMFGYTAAEAVGQSIRIIIPVDRQNEEDFLLTRIRAGKSIRHYETFRRRKDGSRLPISLTVSPIYDDRGTVIAASKIARNMSERTELRVGRS